MNRQTYLLTSWEHLPSGNTLRHITGLTVHFSTCAGPVATDIAGPVAFAWANEEQWLGHIVAGRDKVADWVHRELAGMPSWRDHLHLTLARLMSEAGERFSLAPAAAAAGAQATTITSARTC